MPILKNQIISVVKHAKLELTDNEVTTLAHQLHALLEYAEVLAELKLDEAEPVTLRGDALPSRLQSQSLEQKEVLALAPDSFQGMIRVPRVIEYE